MAAIKTISSLVHFIGRFSGQGPVPSSFPNWCLAKQHPPHSAESPELAFSAVCRPPSSSFPDHTPKEKKRDARQGVALGFAWLNLARRAHPRNGNGKTAKGRKRTRIR